MNTPSEMRETVRGLVEKGADVIKVSQTGAIQNSYDPNVQSDPEAPLRPRFTSEELRIMAREAHQSGVLITAHAHGGPSAGWLIEAGFDAIEHCTFFTREDLELMADRGTFLVATTGYLNLDPGTHDAEMFAFEKENFERALESCHRVYSMAREAGVKVAVGTDTKHGAIPGEMKFLVDCGWSPMEAIMAATKMGAECCGVPDAGTLEPGKFGDLIAVGGGSTPEPLCPGDCALGDARRCGPECLRSRKMEKIALQSERLPPPDGPFSHGVKVGNLVFIAGQAAVDQEGRVVGKGDKVLEEWF